MYITLEDLLLIFQLVISLANLYINTKKNRLESK